MLLLIVLEGCSSAPLAEKYFTRSTPLSTVKMFQYAVETKQYDSAFACLNPAKIQEYSPTRFRWFVRLGSIEEWDGLRVRKLIVDSERLGEQILASETNVARVVLLYEENEDSDAYELGVYLDHVADEWLIDLVRTISDIAGAKREIARSGSK